MLSLAGIAVFIIVLVIFFFIGFYARRWRRGDLSKIDEWALGGRRFGAFILWFLVGADVYTAYTFVAIPSSVFSIGAIYFYAVPYVAVTFGIAMWTMPKLSAISRQKGYITGADYVKGSFNSRNLAILIAIVGIVAELPYIGLQIEGMESVFTVMLFGLSSLAVVTTLSLIIAFAILAAFTWFSGLRGATLTAIFKDAIILFSVVVVIVVAMIEIGFTKSFADLPVKYYHVLPVDFNAYWSLFLMSALALYLYPHAITGSLSAKSPKSLRLSQSLLPVYGVGLALLALFGILIYGDSSALHFLVTNFAASSRGLYVVPALIFYILPSPLTGLAFLGIFIGGLVPASIMAIAQSNLLTRNIIKEFRPHLSSIWETNIAKIGAVVFVFIALIFTKAFPLTYAVQLQLLGGIIILQTLPSIFLALVTNKMNKYAVMAGLLAGLATGIYWMEVANNFSVWKTTLISTTSALGPFFIGLLALGVNLIIVLVGSLLAYPFSKKQPKVEKTEGGTI